jgi:hypothetical protein
MSVVPRTNKVFPRKDTAFFHGGRLVSVEQATSWQIQEKQNTRPAFSLELAPVTKAITLSVLSGREIRRTSAAT